MRRRLFPATPMQCEAGVTFNSTSDQKPPENLYLISVTGWRALDLEKADECASLKTTQLADTVIAAQRIRKRPMGLPPCKGVIKFSPSRILDCGRVSQYLCNEQGIKDRCKFKCKLPACSGNYLACSKQLKLYNFERTRRLFSKC